jgi:O-antigen/teichoic acid export membrane protein
MTFSTINCFATPVSLMAQYEEKAKIQLLSKVFAVYSVAAMLLMIPIMGLYGAALASGSAQALKNLFVWWHVRHRAVWLNGWAAFSTSLLLWGGAVAVCYALKSVIAAPSYVHLGLGVIVFAAIGLLCVRSPVLCGTDRELLQRLFGGKETRLLRRLGVINPA